MINLTLLPQLSSPNLKPRTRIHLSTHVSDPPAVAAMDAMTRGWAPWTHLLLLLSLPRWYAQPCSKSARDESVSTLGLCYHEHGIRSLKAVSSMPGGMSKRAEVGCRLSRFAVKQMYITYWARHVTNSNSGVADCLCCGQPTVINFWWRVLWHPCLWSIIKLCVGLC